MGYADDLIKVLSSSPSRSIYTQKGYDAVRELLAELDRYRDALEFYADSESYETETRPMWSRAREALKEGAVT